MEAALKNLSIEFRRLERILQLDLTHRTLDGTFDDAVVIASKVCGMPMASINILDDKYQWIKNGIGAMFPTYSSRYDAMCNITIEHPDEVTTIPDAKLDSRVSSTSWVLNDIIRAYAGAPLVTNDGLALGSLCVYHPKTPMILTSDQREILQRLAHMVVRTIENLDSNA